LSTPLLDLLRSAAMRSRSLKNQVDRPGAFLITFELH
jgi:hypothetical protein